MTRHRFRSREQTTPNVDLDADLDLFEGLEGNDDPDAVRADDELLDLVGRLGRSIEPPPLFFGDRRQRELGGLLVAWRREAPAGEDRPRPGLTVRRVRPPSRAGRSPLVAAAAALVVMVGAASIAARPEGTPTGVGTAWAAPSTTVSVEMDALGRMRPFGIAEPGFAGGSSAWPRRADPIHAEVVRPGDRGAVGAPPGDPIAPPVSADPAASDSPPGSPQTDIVAGTPIAPNTSGGATRRQSPSPAPTGPPDSFGEAHAAGAEAPSGGGSAGSGSTTDSSSVADTPGQEDAAGADPPSGDAVGNGSNGEDEPGGTAANGSAPSADDESPDAPSGDAVRTRVVPSTDLKRTPRAVPPHDPQRTSTSATNATTKPTSTPTTATTTPATADR
ncbi:hypothetical protein ACFPK1_27230 [Actinomycetospora rhizophila]|uniref:Anti-sigma-D factor RsdA-like protein n=1 Tax=Actinomycetospora rhizophila TaxID=1416876 RepID=A0ABV9ZKK8_9PSEU